MGPEVVLFVERFIIVLLLSLFESTSEISLHVLCIISTLDLIAFMFMVPSNCTVESLIVPPPIVIRVPILIVVRGRLLHVHNIV